MKKDIKSSMLNSISQLTYFLQIMYVFKWVISQNGKIDHKLLTKLNGTDTYVQTMFVEQK